YVLSIEGTQESLPPFVVTATNPANHALTRTPPSQVTVTFSDGIYLPSLDASQLTVDGVAATKVSVVDGRPASVDLAPSAFQWTADVGGNGNYYALTSKAESWADAEAEAEALGGHLTSVLSQGEQNFLSQRFFTDGNHGKTYWIGL